VQPPGGCAGKFPGQGAAARRRQFVFCSHADNLGAVSIGNRQSGALRQKIGGKIRIYDPKRFEFKLDHT